MTTPTIRCRIVLLERGAGWDCIFDVIFTRLLCTMWLPNSKHACQIISAMYHVRSGSSNGNFVREFGKIDHKYPKTVILNRHAIGLIDNIVQFRTESSLRELQDSSYYVWPFTCWAKASVMSKQNDYDSTTSRLPHYSGLESRLTAWISPANTTGGINWLHGTLVSCPPYPVRNSDKSYLHR